jgi:hypothetical protein
MSHPTRASGDVHLPSRCTPVGGMGMSTRAHLWVSRSAQNLGAPVQRWRDPPQVASMRRTATEERRRPLGPHDRPADEAEGTQCEEHRASRAGGWTHSRRCDVDMRPLSGRLGGVTEWNMRRDA